MPADTITIEPRFNGPPDSGNGGYTCGRLAAYVDGPAEVTLRLPPPLGKPMRVERDGDGDGVSLLDGDALVAEARPTEIEIDAPPAVAAEQAAEAAARSGFLDEHRHPFPSCFVCGPLRELHDGLRIFAGELPGDGKTFAAPWTPDAPVTPELIWAALDCPTSAPVWNDPDAPNFRPVVLARLAVRILDEPVAAGERHTILSWPTAFDGRKRHSAAALYTPDGAVAAISRALWIELKPVAA